MKLKKYYLTAAAAVLGASSVSAAMVANFTFDDDTNLGANTGTVATSWNSFTGVNQTAGLFGTGSGSFISGASGAWDSSFAVGANLSSFSISMHVKTPVGGTSWKDFVSIGIGNQVFVLEQTGALGLANYNIGDVGGDAGTTGSSNAVNITDNAWHHIGLTVGGNVATLYVDGANVSSGAYTGSGLITSFQLASRFGEGARSITTEIDDVAIFDTTLSNSEMSFLSNNAAAAVPEPSSAALLGLGGIALILRRRK